MFDRIRTLFASRPTPSLGAADALPVELQTILAGASFLERGADDEGAPRIIVTTTRGAFRYGNDTASAWLREWFGLNDAQVSRALQMLRARFADYQRLQTTAAPARRSDWASWKPLEL